MAVIPIDRVLESLVDSLLVDPNSAAVSKSLSKICTNYTSEYEATIQKRILPALNVERNYTIDFGTPLSREDTKYRIFSAPGFTQQDTNDVPRACFLEETPGSSSGIEFISVISATRSYESIPRISIIEIGRAHV
jgi:hypothetical protein